MSGNNFQTKSAPFVDNGTVYLPVRDIGILSVLKFFLPVDH